MIERSTAEAAHPSDEIEFVVVRDGIKANAGLLERLSSLTDCRISVVGHEAPRGPGAARNIGLTHSHGTYVAFADDDDAVLLTASLQAVAALDASGHSFAACPYLLNGKPGRSFDSLRLIHSIQFPAALILRRVALWSFVFRRRSLARLDPPFPELSYAEDLIFMLKYLDQGLTWDVCPKPSYDHVMLDDPTSLSRGAAWKMHADDSQKAVEEVMPHLTNWSLRVVARLWQIRMRKRQEHAGRSQ